MLTHLPSCWMLLKTDPGFSADFLQDTNAAPPAPGHVLASFVHEVPYICIHRSSVLTCPKSQVSKALGLLLYQNMLYVKKPSRPPPSRKRDFRGFLREIWLHVCLVCVRVRMHEMPRIPCFSASAEFVRFLCARLRGDGAWMMYRVQREIRNFWEPSFACRCQMG